MTRLLRVTQTWPFRRIPFVQGAAKSLASFQQVHGLMRGIPSDEAQRNIAWRVDRAEDMGLLWFAPTVEAIGTRVRRIMDVASPLYERHRFELPVTFTLVTPERVVGAFSISFNRRKAEDVARAHALYNALRESLAREGIYGYRSGVLGMEHVVYPQPGKLGVLRALKAKLDPAGILSPGRYGV